MTKNTWLIVLICIGLGSFYFIARRDRVKVGIRELILPSFDEHSIDKIEIKGAEHIKLSKEDDVWKVSRLLANAEYVNDLLKAAANLESVYFATEREDKQAEFGVSNEAAIKVTLFDSAKPIWELYLGSDAEGGGKYVRVPKTKAIFVAKTKFGDLTRATLNDWRNRQIISLKEDDIVKLIYKKKNNLDITIEWKKEHWHLSKGLEKAFDLKQINEDRINQVVGALVNLRAISFIDSPNKVKSALEDLKNPVFQWVVYNKNGSFYELEIALNSNQIFAKLQGGSQIYEISKYAFERLNITLEDLLFKDQEAKI